VRIKRTDRIEYKVHELVLGEPTKRQQRFLPDNVQIYADLDKPVSEEYFMVLCNWIRNLERKHYKNCKFDLDETLDRVSEFLQYARENKHMTGEWTMATWRIQFAKVETLRELKKLNIDVFDQELSITDKLRHPMTRWFTKLFALARRMSNAGVPMTMEAIADEWMKDARNKGGLARENFLRQYARWSLVLLECAHTERAWAERSVTDGFGHDIGGKFYT